MSERRQVLLRVDPAVHDALMRWANDEFRSVNAQVEMLLRRALTDAGRMPKQAAPLPKRGRPVQAGRRGSRTSQWLRTDGGCVQPVSAVARLRRGRRGCSG